MENRIKIGDEWYVKESSLQTDVEASLIDQSDVIKTKTSLWENNMFCFEGSHDINTGMLEMIIFTDKRNQDYPFAEKECWDNEQWFLSVFKNVPNAFDEFDEGDTELIETIKAFINIVYDIFH